MSNSFFSSYLLSFLHRPYYYLNLFCYITYSSNLSSDSKVCQFHVRFILYFTSGPPYRKLLTLNASLHQLYIHETPVFLYTTTQDVSKPPFVPPTYIHVLDTFYTTATPNSWSRAYYGYRRLKSTRRYGLFLN